LKQEVEHDPVEGPSTPGGRVIVNACYDNVHQVELAACNYLLQVLEKYTFLRSRPPLLMQIIIVYMFLYAYILGNR